MEFPLFLHNILLGPILTCGVIPVLYGYQFLFYTSNNLIPQNYCLLFCCQTAQFLSILFMNRACDGTKSSEQRSKLKLSEIGLLLQLCQVPVVINNFIVGLKYGCSVYLPTFSQTDWVVDLHIQTETLGTTPVFCGYFRCLYQLKRALLQIYVRTKPVGDVLMWYTPLRVSHWI